MYISQLFSNQAIKHSEFVLWGVFVLRFLIRPIGGIVVCRCAAQDRLESLGFCNMLTNFTTISMALLPVETVGQYVVIIFLVLQMLHAENNQRILTIFCMMQRNLNILELAV